ncbi:MAG: hypothetical protein NC452_11490, partial [Eubacterium sp.]|nr:hypothetical protein [Eubacterium sp.]
MKDWCVDNQEAIKDLLRKHNVTVQELKKNFFKEEKFYLLLEEIIYNSKKKFAEKEENLNNNFIIMPDQMVGLNFIKISI